MHVVHMLHYGQACALKIASRVKLDSYQTRQKIPVWHRNADTLVQCNQHRNQSSASTRWWATLHITFFLLQGDWQELFSV